MTQPAYKHLHPVTGPTPYTELTQDMEALAVYYAATDPHVYLALGQYLDPESLRATEPRSILQAARQVTAQGTRVSAPVVLSQVYQRVHARQLTPDQYATHEAWVERVRQLATTTQASAVVDTVAPLIKRRLRTALTQRLATANLAGAERECDEIADQLARVSNIGRPTAHSWAGLDGDTWGLIASLRRTQRLSTGIPELDDALDGGIPIGTITTWGADPGIGKTAAMLTQMAANVRLGRRCVYLTSEIGVPQAILRLVGILTGIPQAEIARGTPRAMAALEAELADPHLGSFAVAYLPSGSTLGQLDAALTELTDRDPRYADGWDACWVDYGDLMAGGPHDRSSYDTGGTVWRGLRRMAEDVDGHPPRWMTTASQLKDPGNRRGTAGDLADSRHKGNVSDTVILLDQPDDVPEQRTARPVKVRDGRAGVTVGPFDTDLACGRFYREPGGTWDQ